MLHLVLINGKETLVDQEPIWQVRPNTGEISIGYLADGTKVEKIKPPKTEYIGKRKNQVKKYPCPFCVGKGCKECKFIGYLPKPEARELQTRKDILDAKKSMLEEIKNLVAKNQEKMNVKQLKKVVEFLREKND